jgi:ADP-glucose pyrophosphorylase
MRIRLSGNNPWQPRKLPVSMGIYLFNASDIIHELKADDGTSSAHDFGSNILPEMMKSGRILCT